QVAASPTPAAKEVAGPKLRTPSGPSAILSLGKLRRGMSRMKKPSTPPRRSIFSSRVIWLRIESMRRSISADDRMEGVGACADEINIAERIKATIEQSLRIRFSFGLTVTTLGDFMLLSLRPEFFYSCRAIYCTSKFYRHATVSAWNRFDEHTQIGRIRFLRRHRRLSL